MEYSYTNVKGTHKVWTDAIRYHDEIDETAGWRATSTCITEESKSYKMRYHKRNITGIKGSQNQSSLGSKLVFSERGQDHNQEMLLYAILLREQMGHRSFRLAGHMYDVLNPTGLGDHVAGCWIAPSPLNEKLGRQLGIIRSKSDRKCHSVSYLKRDPFLPV